MIADLQRDILEEDLATATLNQYVDRFLKYKGRHKFEPKSLGYYRIALSRFTDWMGEAADNDIAFCQSLQITKYRTHLLGHYAESTAKNQLKRIRTMFQKALAEGMIDEDPTANVQLPSSRGGKEERKAFSMAQLKSTARIHHWRVEKHDSVRSVHWPRLGDVACLRWSSVDLDQNEVRFSTRKTGQYVPIPIALPLREHILEMNSSDDHHAFVHPRAERVTRSIALHN